MPKKSAPNAALTIFGRMADNQDDRDIDARFVGIYLYVVISEKLHG
jgi:hypothetical protein